jgi:hypothetical protein
MLKKRKNTGSNINLLKVEYSRKTSTFYCGLMTILLLSLSFSSYCQDSIKNNIDRLDKLKTRVSKSELEKNIVGRWNFIHLTSSSGKIISKTNIQIDTLSLTEEIDRPSYAFLNNKEYLIIDKKRDTIDRGKWFYDDKERILNLIYKVPKYNYPVEQLSPQLLEKLKGNNQIREIAGTYLEIHKISNNQLVLIEHIPHNEFELKYNLSYYIREEYISN